MIKCRLKNILDWKIKTPLKIFDTTTNVSVLYQNKKSHKISHESSKRAVMFSPYDNVFGEVNVLGHS